MTGGGPSAGEVKRLMERTESYLTDVLLPFWVERSPDAERGGFLTYFDEFGRRTGETTKTFLMQIRMLFTMASAHRAGYGGGRCGELARAGADFILEHYWDEERGGWYWIADREGRPLVKDKIGYGQCFAIYAFSEHFLATEDQRGREAALASYSAVMENMADSRYGGFLEIMDEDWQPAGPGPAGGDRKSMDVHMHMMEALTRLYEMTGAATHRRRLQEVIDLITDRMIEPETGTGYMQFGLDFRPLPAIDFDVEWGRDAEPEDGGSRPLDHTSPGHNVEFAWLLLHAMDTLGRPREDYAETIRKICDHCVEYGIDWECGGVYAEAPMDRPTQLTEKQFWQQAEVLVGMLDAYALLGEPRYWQAFRNVYDFVFDRFVVMEAGGEWYERLDREGNPIDRALGHAWKISYHTVRSMVQTTKRLRALAERC